MSNNINRFQIDINNYKDSGLYLITKTEQIDFTHKVIEQLTLGFWSDASKLSNGAKAAADFQRCDFCPLKDGSMCDAIRPILPLLESLKDYGSIDEVTAIYKKSEDKTSHIADTDMQSALKAVSILSITEYCQVAKRFRKYFDGIIPVMSGKEVARRIYLNVFWLFKGDIKTVENKMQNFRDIILETTQNQSKRLNLIVSKDSLKNAYVNLHVISEMLTMDFDKKLSEHFKSYEV